MGLAVEIARPLGRRSGGARSFGWGLVSQGASSTTNLALTLMAGRLLGPAGLGTVFLGFALYLLVLGFQRALVTDPLVTSSTTLGAPARRLVTGSALTVAILGALAGSLLLAAVGALVRGELGQSLLLFAPWLLPALVQDFWRVVLFRDGREAAGAANDLLWLLVLGATAPLALLSGSAWAVVACWGAGALASSTAGLVQTGVRPRRPAAALAWWRLDAWPLGRWLGLEGILWAAGSYATILLLVGLLGTRSLGGLRAVQSLFAPLALLASATSLPGLPALSQTLAVSPSAARRLAVSLLVSVGAVGLVYTAVLGLGGGTALTLLFGEAFARFEDLTWPLGTAQVLAAAPVGAVLLLKAQRRGRDLVVARAFGVAASLGLVVFLASTYGLRGAAWGLAAGALAGSLAMLSFGLLGSPDASRRPGAFGRLALVLFRLLPPQAYRRLRRAPLVGPALRGLLDVVLPSRGWAMLSVAAGPLRGTPLNLDPRLHKEMVSGRYEPEVQEAVQELLAPGDVAFDVGAHLGYFSLSMAARVGPSGRVLAFEPNPLVLEQLRGSVCANASRAGAVVTPIAAAVGARSGQASFSPGEDTSTGKLALDGDLVVEVLTLDDAAKRFGVPRFVKIDVEGGELDVLRGGAGLLGGRSTAFLIETHSDELASDCQQLLRSRDYSCRRLEESARGREHLVAYPPRWKVHR